MATTVHHTSCPLCGSNDLKPALKTKDYSISQEAFDLYDCADCGLRFTQDVPDEAHIGAYYQSEDYISHSDTKKGLVNTLYHWARNYMLGQKRKMVAHLTSHRTLLDIGAGTGYFMQHMRQHGYQVDGVEIDPGAREYAKTQFSLDIRPPADLTEGRIKGRFGIISMWHVLEHVQDFHGYLARIRELLEDDGVLMIAVPNFTSHDARHYGKFWAAYDVPRHLWHFSPTTLEHLAETAGFALTGKRRLPLDPFYVSLLSEKYRGNGVSGLITGGITGLRSHLKSLGKIDRSSSLVYLFKKNL